MIYYPHISSDWDEFVRSRGYGQALSDVISCVVTEERNGIFDLELEYPYGGANAQMIDVSAIIAAKTEPDGTLEPFRIFSVDKDVNGLMRVKAHAAVYDTDGIILEPFSVSTLNTLITKLNGHDNPAGLPIFRVSQSGWIDAPAEMEIAVPTSLFACLGQAAETVDGELKYHFNHSTGFYEITIMSDRGSAVNAAIGYGINILTFDQEENNEDVYTAIYPYYYDDNAQTLVKLPEKTVSTGATGKARILPVDLTREFQTTPTVAQLRTAANAYVSEHSFVPAVSTAFDFVPLASTTEYSDQGEAQRISLCDTITVQAAQIGVSVTAKVVKTVYNVLLSKYAGLTAGSIMPTIADTIARLEKDVKK